METNVYSEKFWDPSFLVRKEDKVMIVMKVAKSECLKNVEWNYNNLAMVMSE